jgi:hypothetical protein
VERDGPKVLATNVELTSPSAASIPTRARMETGSEETPEGVVGVSMKQYTGDKATVVLNGRVDGNQLLMQIDNGRKFDRKTPWNADAVGLSARNASIRKRRSAGRHPGVPQLRTDHQSPRDRRAAVKDFEEVDVLGDKRKLLRVEAAPDKVKGPNGEQVPLPKMTLWLGEGLLPVCSAVEMPGLGALKLYRTTKEVALAKGPPPKNIDIGLNSLVKLNKVIPRATSRRRVPSRSRTTTHNDVRPDARYVRTFRAPLELHVKRGPSASAKPRRSASRSARRRHQQRRREGAELAKKAVGNENDA